MSTKTSEWQDSSRLQQLHDREIGRLEEELVSESAQRTEALRVLAKLKVEEEVIELRSKNEESNQKLVTAMQADETRVSEVAEPALVLSNITSRFQGLQTQHNALQQEHQVSLQRYTDLEGNIEDTKKQSELTAKRLHLAHRAELAKVHEDAELESQARKDAEAKVIELNATATSLESLLKAAKEAELTPETPEADDQPDGGQVANENNSESVKEVQEELNLAKQEIMNWYMCVHGDGSDTYPGLWKQLQNKTIELNVLENKMMVSEVEAKTLKANELISPVLKAPLNSVTQEAKSTDRESEPIVQEPTPTVKKFEPTIKEFVPTVKEFLPTAKELEVVPAVKELATSESTSSAQSFVPSKKQTELLPTSISSIPESLMEAPGRNSPKASSMAALGQRRRRQSLRLPNMKRQMRRWNPKKYGMHSL